MQISAPNKLSAALLRKPVSNQSTLTGSVNNLSMGFGLPFEFRGTRVRHVFPDFFYHVCVTNRS